MTPKNNVENDVENIFINNPKNNFGNFVSDGDLVEVDIVVAHVVGVNNIIRKENMHQK